MSLSAFQITLLTDALKLGVQVFSRLSGQIRIVESLDDVLPGGAVCRSREQLTGTAMSVAAISQGDAYKDSGKRYLFALEGGVAKVRSPGEPLRVIAGQRTGPATVSYHRRRNGEIERHLPAFDMIAAGAGRVLVKEKNAARFYFTVLDPQFRFHGQQTIRSAYFKLDPETGQPDADNADRLAHLADEDIRHPAAIRFPLFRLMLSVDQIDNMAVNVDRNLGVWHRIDMRAPENGIDPPKGLPHVPKAVDLVTYAYADGSTITKKGLPIHRVLDLGVGHEHWHEQESAVYGGEMDSLAGPGLPPILMEHDVYRFFNGPVHDKGGFIDGTANYYLLAQLVPDDELQRGRRPNAFGILWMDEQAVFSERWRLLHPDDCQFGDFRNLVPSSLVQYLAKTPWYHTIAFDRRRYFCPFRAMHVGPLSRMAVARQVIVVSGYDPQSGRHLLYTINFSFGTCDRTWRWRRLPPLHTVTGSTGTIDTDPDRVPFVHVGLREDMTLYVVQEHQNERTTWYQRYLPATHEHRPDGKTLQLPSQELVGRGVPALARLVEALAEPARIASVANAPMPSEGFDHAWQRLPTALWEEIHTRYSHFGCLQDEVNWRGQYYQVDVDPREIPAGTLEDDRLEDASGSLFIRKLCLDWQELNEALASVEGVTTTVTGWAKEIERILRELDAARRALDDRIARLLAEAEAIWDQAFDGLEQLLEQIAASGRAGARQRIKSAVVDLALDALRAQDLYKLAPAEARQFARDTLRSLVNSVLDSELFDGLWSAVASVAGAAADVMAEVRNLDAGGNQTNQIRDRILDRIEQAVRDHFGGSSPRLRLSFRVSLNLGPIRFDERFDLGRVNVPLDALVQAVRGAIGALGLFEDAVRDLAAAAQDALEKAAERLRAEAERAGLLAQADRLVHPRELREQIVSVIDRMVDAGLFVRTVHRRSLFHDRFLLKLLHRPPVGYILVHWDKRDDDLLPFNELSPHRSTAIAIRLRRPDGREFPAAIRSWRRVLSPPVVTRAEVRVKRSASGAPTALSIRITIPLEADALEENVWRVRMGALPATGSGFGTAEVFLDVLRHERFEQATGGSEHTLTWDLSQEASQVRDQIRRYCTEQGRQQHGTSLWFENIVGQVSTPDVLTFV